MTSFDLERSLALIISVEIALKKKAGISKILQIFYYNNHNMLSARFYIYIEKISTIYV
jgi:hypothetical protein